MERVRGWRVNLHERWQNGILALRIGLWVEEVDNQITEFDAHHGADACGGREGATWKERFEGACAGTEECAW